MRLFKSLILNLIRLIQFHIKNLFSWLFIKKMIILTRMFKKNCISQRGNILIQVIIAFGLMSVLAIGFATMMSDQNKQIKALNESLVLKDAEARLQQSFLRTDYCSCVLRGKNFDTTSGGEAILAVNQLTSLKSGYLTGPLDASPCNPTADDSFPVAGSFYNGTQIKIASVQLVDMKPLSPGTYKADIEVGFTNTIRVLKPIKVNITFAVDTTAGSIASRPFLSCKPVNPGGGGVQAGTYSPAIACHANNCCYGVSFPTPFATAPKAVTVTPFFTDYGHTNAAITSGVQGLSVNGFTACFDHIGHTIDNNFLFYWIAVE